MEPQNTTKVEVFEIILRNLNSEKIEMSNLKYLSIFKLFQLISG